MRSNAHASPVIQVVEGDYCHGCGICAGLCPSGALTMKLNALGEFTPVENGQCNSCMECSRACPQLKTFGARLCISSTSRTDAAGILNIDSASDSTWAGHATDEAARLSSASGGLLTALLASLLQTRQVDAVAVVLQNGSSVHPLFQAELTSSIAQVRQASGSKYYPVHFADLLRGLRQSKKAVAVVGLPCHCEALRAAMSNHSWLRQRMRFVFGLTCGHGVSTGLTDLLLHKAQVTLQRGDILNYRTKHIAKPLQYYSFSVTRNGVNAGKHLHFAESMYREAWMNRWFTPRSCDFCADTFAASADMTFMDAWLPEYTSDARGTSLVIGRQAEAIAALKRLATDGLASIRPVTPSDVVRSQARVVQYKRDQLPSRVQLARSMRRAVPIALREMPCESVAAASEYGERRRMLERVIARLPLGNRLRSRTFACVASHPLVYAILMNYFSRMLVQARTCRDRLGGKTARSADDCADGASVSPST